MLICICVCINENYSNVDLCLPMSAPPYLDIYFVQKSIIKYNTIFVLYLYLYCIFKHYSPLCISRPYPNAPFNSLEIFMEDYYWSAMVTLHSNYYKIGCAFGYGRNMQNYRYRIKVHYQNNYIATRRVASVHNNQCTIELWYALWTLVLA